MAESNGAALVRQENGVSALQEMSVQDVVARKRKICEVMDAVMREGEHYGKIPGCGDKPTLLKPGAEVLAMTFGLAPEFKITHTDLPGGHREYEIVCTLIHAPTGRSLGQGVGLCSTMESKYRWRKGERRCPECGKATIIKGKAEYGGGWLCFRKKGGCDKKWPDGAQEIEGQSTDRVENPDLADTYNTVLKMAKKRAQVDCTLTATGASDLLTQDLEDLPVYERREQPSAEDAEWRDVPRTWEPPSQRAPATEDEDFARFADPRSAESTVTRQPPKAAKPRTLDEIADALIVELKAAPDREAVNALAPRFGELPKGTSARDRAAKVYTAELARTALPKAEAR